METLEHIVQQMETERELDRSAAIADMRFDFIERLCEQYGSKAESRAENGCEVRRLTVFLPENIRRFPVLSGSWCLFFT